MKKLVLILVIAIFVNGYYNPCFAKNNKVSTKKLEKIEETKDKYEYINMDWWNKFNDPYLVNYIQRAIEYNHNLKIATLSTKEYYQMVKMQFANELPSANAGFAPAYVKLPNTTSSGFQFALPVLANYEIDLFLKNRDKTKSAYKIYEMSLLDERSAYISVAGAVGATYFNIIKLDKNIELQKQIVDERKLIFELMSKRNAQGITSTADMVRANKAYVSAITELTELEKQRDSLLNSFCVLMGESSENADNIERIGYDDINFTGTIPETIESEIIEQRPDYLKAVYNVEKAGIDVRIAKKEFLPSFNIGGLALFNASDIGKMFNTTKMLSAIGGLANVDLFQGGAKIANLKMKKAAYEKVLEHYQQTNLTAIQEINDALLFVKKDNEKLINTLKQKDFETKDNEYFQKKYEKGIISKLDLAQSDENLLTIDKLAVNQQIDCYIDYIGLYKAVGSKL
ncbi:TolC family protein [bacterium]|nr:TolC family protein [bacterium]